MVHKLKGMGFIDTGSSDPFVFFPVFSPLIPLLLYLDWLVRFFLFIECVTVVFLDRATGGADGRRGRVCSGIIIGFDTVTLSLYFSCGEGYHQTRTPGMDF